MNQHRPIDERLSRWFLEEAPAESPDRVLQATLARTRVARQERTVLGWRVGEMFPRALAATAIVAAVAVAGIGVAGLGRPDGSVGDPAAPSPTVAPSPDRSFKTSAWTLRYRLPANDWQIGESTVEINFHRTQDGDVPNDVTIGRLEAAVHPDSQYVVYPDLDESVDTSVDGYLAWLQQHPRVDTTEPREVSVAGRPAIQVDVTLKPGEGSRVSRLGLMYFGADSPAVGPSDGETHRLLLLEVGGETVVIDIWSEDIEAHAAAAQPLLDSFVFEE